MTLVPEAIRTALITGATRGIGYEVARELAKRKMDVTIGARDEKKGQAAVEKLEKEGLVVRFLRMDVVDAASVRSAAAAYANVASRLDVLINNAAVLLDGNDDATKVAPDTFEQTLRTNTVAPVRVTQAFLPFLQKSRRPRVINVSSGAGQLSEMSGTWAPAYSVSKAALNAVTLQLANALPGMAVNAVCPGWVRTDMGGPDAPRSVAEGAATIVWLATDAPPHLRGKFLRDRKPIAW